MEAWFRITLILCTYGIFKEIRPSEPFLTEYLEGPWVNLTSEQVNHEIYPIWTYSYLSFLIVVMLVTDFVRYKPVLIVEGLGYIVTWCLLLWSRKLLAMQFMQAAYGIATSTEVAYFTYIYCLVPIVTFQKVTSYARAALLFGRFLSGIISQILISTKVMDFYSLNYISFASVLICFLIAISLPMPEKSVYLEQAIQSDEDKQGNCMVKCKLTIKFIITTLKKSYSDHNLFLWSLWWAIATGGNIQVGNYIQSLWEDINPTWNSTGIDASSRNIYNGAVEATHTLLSSIVASSVSCMHIRLQNITELLLGTLTAAECLVLFLMARTSTMWVAYITYIIFRTVYQLLITIVSYHVAEKLSPDSHGLIFGANTFIALVLQTLLTITVADKSGLHLKPRTQYSVYSVYFGILAALFIVVGIIQCCSKVCGKKRKKQDKMTES